MCVCSCSCKSRFIPVLVSISILTYICCIIARFIDMLNVYVYVYVEENYEKEGCMRKDTPM